QTIAVALWGIALAIWASVDPETGVPWRRIAALLSGAALLVICILANWIVLRTPLGPTLCAVGLLTATSLVVMTAGRLARGPSAAAAHAAARWGLMLAGLWAAAVAAIQTLRPEWTDGLWLAHPVAGRATANLNQPNHLGLVLAWAMLASAAFAARPR